MTIDLALEKLIPGLQEIYGDLIDSIVLYGSTARGTRTEDSDVDVAILLRAGATKAMREQMLDLVVDLELECGKVLSVLCIDYDNVIAAVNMRGKDGLVFSAEYCGNLRCETTEHHAFCIYNVPLTLHGFCFCHIAFHAMSSKGMLNFLIK